jgi:hypothetical protein
MTEWGHVRGFWEADKALEKYVFFTKINQAMYSSCDLYSKYVLLFIKMFIFFLFFNKVGL